MRVEETGGEKSNLAFVKVNTWPFAQQEVIVLHMLACGGGWGGHADFPKSEYHLFARLSPCVCLFVRVFITSGFTTRLSLHPSTDPY